MLVCQRQALLKAGRILAKSAGPQQCRHVFSCDNQPYVQQYILTNHKPEHLFVDLGDLSGTVAFCMKEREDSIVHKVNNTSVGWVCKTASRQNPKRDKKCIANASGQTGETFQQVKSYLQSEHGPDTFVGENVNAFVLHCALIVV
jgi:hypothetical protein